MPNFKKNPNAMGSPYKMKGSPMQRNFGIGSPMQHKGTHPGPGEKGDEGYHEGHKSADEQLKALVTKKDRGAILVDKYKRTGSLSKAELAELDAINAAKAAEKKKKKE